MAMYNKKSHLIFSISVKFATFAGYEAKDIRNQGIQEFR